MNSLSKLENPEDFLYSWWDHSENRHKYMGDNNLGMHPNDAMFWYGIAGFIYSAAASGFFVPLAPKLNLNPTN